MMSLTSTAYGHASPLIYLYSGAGDSNWLVLQTAWPSGLWSQGNETFAENFADKLGYSDQYFSGGGQNYQSQDYYLSQSTGGFQCIWHLQQYVGQSGVQPSGSSYPSGCPSS